MPGQLKKERCSGSFHLAGELSGEVLLEVSLEVLTADLPAIGLQLTLQLTHRRFYGYPLQTVYYQPPGTRCYSRKGLEVKREDSCICARGIAVEE
jgi:hypothetical protein